MEIAAGRFKAQCLSLMDHVHDSHERVVITKHGRPVAQMVAVGEEKAAPLFGRLEGLLRIESDILGPPDVNLPGDADG
ncbi:MAG: type II toxin-antitoxin system prevent-host-death family antitoxin [Spirochaetes bacterium]|jgi:prevent-host-death family protein|nr:type II toxin-antitoxin system prevent-host-death family antitoxin [Spirochaetota bacterium]